MLDFKNELLFALKWIDMQTQWQLLAYLWLGRPVKNYCEQRYLLETLTQHILLDPARSHLKYTIRQ